ncbi:hypothetical protein QBC47DRAFT_389961 [Echria macrotheca]|uniref:Uncharacterized protein n=1 Tax=Echria macrotheca TaxID=438768 RepID=A0AAJ0B6N0_9PEZI|nr:hypothetical protein QBC47DRAFT_389961 [Echria macrotheca]
MTIQFGAARNESVWQPEPGGRGTYSLLSSCLVTMILCVWTAVHLNIPGPELEPEDPCFISKWRRWRRFIPQSQTSRKIGWLTIGLFAPEIIAWTAFEQRREAKDLYREMRKKLGEGSRARQASRLTRLKGWIPRWLAIGRKKEEEDVEKGNSGSDDNIERNTASGTPTEEPSERDMKRRYQWTMTHSYYASMGGFVFDTSVIGSGADFLPRSKRMTLTNRGLLCLTETVPHLLPNISVAQIRDKSKANRLAKTIVTLQASWFAAQCISRLALGMTISLLELNTFAHAICALIAYALWWDKPLDVEEPTLIEGPDAELVCAAIAMRTSVGLQLFYKLHEDTAGRHPDHSLHPSMVYWPSVGDEYADDRVKRGVTGFMQRGSDGMPLEICPTVPPDRLDNLTAFRLYMGQSLFNFALIRHHLEFDLRSCAVDHGLLAMGRPYVEIDSDHLLLLRLANDGYVKYPGLAPDVAGGRGGMRGCLASYRTRNWPTGHGTGTEAETSTVLFSLFFAGLAYGGLHLLAWSPPVRTAAETTILRVSGVSIIVYGAFPLLGWWLNQVFWKEIQQAVSQWQIYKTSPYYVKGFYFKFSWLIRNYLPGGQFLYDVYVRFGRTIVVSLVLTSIGAGTLLYVVSRVYLVVECFISLGRLPASVFETPVWSQYLPHVN